ncbi:hypothetical protein [Paraferrimonas sedimenticola]|uniref:Rap1a immunity protein domain-containing protein n=1 Tax=Paraferrimonas sedimenticola TaxID=375674 RepID=A0AA37RY96_9GAMM|nr:hypothetical protein [Paraferrimonas sedimenticola]GLP97199.1 hypothetical protein GCM10007895_25060 [Paraferrimonas sedimenticola]
MKSQFLIGSFAAVCLPAMASMQHCQEDVDSALCQSYLSGKVAGALAYSDKFGLRASEQQGFSNRALNTRANNAVVQANKRYCQDRIPSNEDLVTRLGEGIEQGRIANDNDLTRALRSKLDCERLP